jgi:hypothetical protein
MLVWISDWQHVIWWILRVAVGVLIMGYRKYRICAGTAWWGLGGVV